MSLFRKLFGNKKLKAMDADLGEIESFSITNTRVGWQANKKYLGFHIEILMEGNRDGISKNHRQMILELLKEEDAIKAEAEKALKEQFENAEMEFISLEKHFELKGISVKDEGYEMAFQEKKGQNYFFNIQFKNNKYVGISIDG